MRLMYFFEKGKFCAYFMRVILFKKKGKFCAYFLVSAFLTRKHLFRVISAFLVRNTSFFCMTRTRYTCLERF